MSSNVLRTIQQKLKVPKLGYNSFGKYPFRNVEGIVKALKPLLEETKSTVTFQDEVVERCGQPYLQAIATLETEGSEVHYSAKAYAKHATDAAGQQPPQM